ncbi:hypothetical protein CHI12_18455, partial [Terribacillus saccharophilus]
LNYIGYDSKEVFYELSEFQIRGYNVSKITRELGNLTDDELEKQNLNTSENLDDKILKYSNILEELAQKLKTRSRRTFFEKKIDRAKSNIGNISFIGEHYLIESIFVLEKFSLMYRAAREFNSNLKDGRRKLLSIHDLEKYPGGKESLTQDIQLLEYFSIHLLTDVWCDKSSLDEPIPLSMFSSGELSMFIRLFDLHEYVKDNSIVLIDEPETHLHPLWIRGYIRTLIKLLGDRKCHVIIATHSPLIVSDVTKNCIVALQKNGNSISQVHIDEKTLGLNYEEVLSDIFYLEESKGRMVNEYENIINELLSANEYDKALEIYSHIADSDTKYRIYLKLKKFKDTSEGNSNV